MTVAIQITCETPGCFNAVLVPERALLGRATTPAGPAGPAFCVESGWLPLPEGWRLSRGGQFRCPEHSRRRAPR